MALIQGILEFDSYLNAAVDILKTCIAQNYKGTEEFCDRFSSTFNPVAPSILYMWMRSVVLKTRSISVSTSALVHPPCKFWFSVYRYGHLILVPEVLNVPIFNNYDNHKNSLTDFWREDETCLNKCSL
jgi:hypothetical protein